MQLDLGGFGSGRTDNIFIDTRGRKTPQRVGIQVPILVAAAGALIPHGPQRPQPRQHVAGEMMVDHMLALKDCIHFVFQQAEVVFVLTPPPRAQLDQHLLLQAPRRLLVPEQEHKNPQHELWVMLQAVESEGLVQQQLPILVQVLCVHVFQDLRVLEEVFEHRVGGVEPPPARGRRDDRF